MPPQFYLTLDSHAPKPPASVLNSSSSAGPEVQREIVHNASKSEELCQEKQKGAQRPASSLPAQSLSASAASAGFISSIREDKVANRLKQTSLPFKNMDEGELSKILVYVREMLGKNPHNPHAKRAAFYDEIIAQGGYVDEALLREIPHDASKRVVSSSATTGTGGKGKDEEFMSDVTLSDEEYELLLTMINTYKKWLPDLLSSPRIVPPELQIQSRDHIPLIAACFTGSLRNVQALYRQVRPSESLSRQLLSIAALRNRTDLAAYCIEQGARLDTNDIYSIHCSIMTGRSFTTCKFLVNKGLDINVNVEFMGDILSAAVNFNYLAWVRFCLENGADPNQSLVMDTYSTLAFAARYASINVVSLLLQHNATLKGSSALALAAQRGKLDMVKFLLKKGAFIDENCDSHWFDTPEQDQQGTALHLVKKGRVDILKYLLESGANPNLTVHKGRTPLEKFLEIKDMKLVRALKAAPSKARPKRAT